MKHYEGYTADEFASDDDFIRWVTAPGTRPDLDRFWKEWIATHPTQMDEIEEARLMIQAVMEEPQFLPGPELQDKVWQRIRQTAQVPEPVSRPVSLWSHWYSKAAVVAIVVGLGWWALDQPRTFHMTNVKIAQGGGVVLKKKANDTA